MSTKTRTADELIPACAVQPRCPPSTAPHHQPLQSSGFIAARHPWELQISFLVLTLRALESLEFSRSVCVFRSAGSQSQCEKVVKRQLADAPFLSKKTPPFHTFISHQKNPANV